MQKEKPMSGGDYLLRRIADLEGTVATLLDRAASLLSRAEAAEARTEVAEKELADLKKPRLVTEESA